MNNKLLQKITLLFAICVICGCTPENTDISGNFKLPEELKDYKVIKLDDSEGRILFVLVKKNEDRKVIGTSVAGKYPIHTIVIDGEEYVKKE